MSSLYLISKLTFGKDVIVSSNTEGSPCKPKLTLHFGDRNTSVSICAPLGD